MAARTHGVEAVARLLDISAWKVRDLIRTAQLGHARIGRRLVVPERALEAYVASVSVEARRGARATSGARHERSAAGQPEAARRLDIRELYPHLVRSGGRS